MTKILEIPRYRLVQNAVHSTTRSGDRYAFEGEAWHEGYTEGEAWHEGCTECQSLDIINLYIVDTLVTHPLDNTSNMDSIQLWRNINVLI